LNSILFYFLTIIMDINTSVFTNITEKPFTFWTEPYIAVMGDFFVASLFGVIGLGVFIGSKNYQATIGYFIIVFLFLAVAVGSILIVIFGLIAGLMTASLLYKALVEKRSS